MEHGTATLFPGMLITCHYVGNQLHAVSKRKRVFSGASQPDCRLSPLAMAITCLPVFHTGRDTHACTTRVPTMQYPQVNRDDE